MAALDLILATVTMARRDCGEEFHPGGIDASDWLWVWKAHESRASTHGHWRRGPDLPSAPRCTLEPCVINDDEEYGPHPVGVCGAEFVEYLRAHARTPREVAEVALRLAN